MAQQLRKVLYSPGYGAGWTTWNSYLIPGKEREATILLLTWPPLIEAVEKKETLDADHPAVRSLVATLAMMGMDAGYSEGFMKDRRGHYGNLYLGGLDQLAVATGYGMCRINESDGSESVVWQDADEGWM